MMSRSDNKTPSGTALSRSGNEFTGKDSASASGKLQTIDGLLSSRPSDAHTRSYGHQRQNFSINWVEKNVYLSRSSYKIHKKLLVLMIDTAYILPRKFSLAAEICSIHTFSLVSKFID